MTKPLKTICEYWLDGYASDRGLGRVEVPEGTTKEEARGFLVKNKIEGSVYHVYKERAPVIEVFSEEYIRMMSQGG